jgi:flavin-binding protein dodecin
MGNSETSLNDALENAIATSPNVKRHQMEVLETYSIIGVKKSNYQIKLRLTTKK